MDLQQAIFIAKQESLDRNEYYQRAQRFGHFRRSYPLWSQLVTSFGSQLVQVGTILQTRYGMQTEGYPPIFEGKDG
ncbi:hypothetical protein KFU94_35085 [Chloroflexi bacterium TSY]|nr:hypothetical protein [Chloroflexi bacterium TSY]